MDAGFVPVLPLHHGYLEPDCVERREWRGGGGLMRGIKIPPHDFALKMQGGGGAYAQGGAYLRDTTVLLKI